MRPSAKSPIIFQLLAGTNLVFLSISESENDTILKEGSMSSAILVASRCMSVSSLGCCEVNRPRDRSKTPHSYARAVYLNCVGTFLISND